MLFFEYSFVSKLKSRRFGYDPKAAAIFVNLDDL